MERPYPNLGPQHIHSLKLSYHKQGLNPENDGVYISTTQITLFRRQHQLVIIEYRSAVIYKFDGLERGY